MFSEINYQIVLQLEKKPLMCNIKNYSLISLTLQVHYQTQLYLSK